MHQPAQKGSRRNDDRFPVEIHRQRGSHADHPPLLHDDAERLGLLYIQVRFTLADPFSQELIGFFVALRPLRPHRGSFAGVQHPKLNGRHISELGDFAPQSINFAGKMRFCEPTHGRIAGKLAHGIQVQGE